MFAYAGTAEYSRGRRTLERTRRVDLDVNYRSLPVQTFHEGMKRSRWERAGEERESRTVRAKGERKR